MAIAAGFELNVIIPSCYAIEEDRIISQEVRISSPEGHGPFEWLGGIYGFKEDVDMEQHYYEHHLTDIEIKGYAVFGQATYTLFDRLHLTAGLRYDHTDSDGSQTYLNAAAQRVDFAKDMSNDEILPKFSIAYDYFAIIQYDYKDKRLPNTPEYSYNLGVQYRHSTGLFARIDILGTGEFYHDTKNRFKQDSYELVDLKLGYEGERFDISLWAKNIFNEEYETVRFEFLSLAAFEGEPRMFGTTLTYRF